MSLVCHNGIATRESNNQGHRHGGEHMPERIKYAAVGCGGMGRRHLRGMARLSRSSFCNLELAAVCDLNQDNANFLADEAHEYLGERPKVYRDIGQMVR